MNGFFSKLISVDEAVDRALFFIKEINLGVEKTSVWNGLNRLVSEDIYAGFNQPCCLKSYVDGYAVKAMDIHGASFSNPVRLFVKGLLKPGDRPGKHVVRHGEAVEVYTGSYLPDGADTVVMYEDTRREGDFVEILRTIPIYSNVAQIGEDFKKGELLVSRKTLLKPQHLAIIASSGLFEINVYERVRIGLICTGSEVFEKRISDNELAIYNSTGVLIKNTLDQHGLFETKYYGLLPDDELVIREILLKALSENHVVLTIGGAGFSENDVVYRVVGKISSFIFRGVALRPGKPTSLAIISNKPVFLLSGFPVAAWCGLEAIVTPILYRLIGLQPPVRPIVKTVLKQNIPNTVGYRSYVRVRIYCENGCFYSEPYGIRGSGVLSSLVKTNGYIVVPESCEGFSEGDVVDAYLY